MITVKENTTLVGISELRTELEEILKRMKHTKVVIEKRNNPIAVLIPIDEFERTQNILDIAEELVLGNLAKQRFEKSKDKDYLTLETVEKKIGIK